MNNNTLAKSEITPIEDLHASILDSNCDVSDHQSPHRAEIFQDHDLLRTVIDNLPDAIYIKDLSARKVMANPAELKNMGCKTEADAVGKK